MSDIDGPAIGEVVTVRLSPLTVAEIDREAAASGTSRAAEIRRRCQGYAARREPTRAQRPGMTTARALAGRWVHVVPVELVAPPCRVDRMCGVDALDPAVRLIRGGRPVSTRPTEDFRHTELTERQAPGHYLRVPGNAGPGRES